MKTFIEKLIETFKADGLELNESQKSELFSFSDKLNEKIAEAKEEGKSEALNGINKIVEDKISEYDEEVKESVGNLIKAIDENNNEKIALKTAEITEDNNIKLVEKIDDYLKLYIKELIPESLVVDYDKLQRQTKALETIKETLLISDDEVQNKAKEVTEKIESELSDSKEKLNESMKICVELNNEVEAFKSKQLLESKLEDIPELEARKLKKYFEDSSSDDIEKDFDTVYESIKKSLNDDDLNEEIKNIVDDVKINEENEETTGETEETEETTEETDNIKEDLMNHYIKILNKSIIK